MIENIKYIAKLSTIAIFTYLKINILAVFSTVMVVIIEFFLLTKDIDAGHSGHVSAIPFLVMTFLSRPIGSILWYLTCFCSPILFFSLGNKYILSKLAHNVISDKSESLIHPLLERILNKFQAKQPKILKNAGDFSVNKLKIIQDIQNDKSENKWLRKIIVFGMKKISLDDVDFSKENQNFFDIIREKTVQSLKDLSEPSRKMIWMTVAAQWGILVFIWLTKF